MMNRRRKKRLLRYALRKVVMICALALLLIAGARCVCPSAAVEAQAVDNADGARTTQPIEVMTMRAVAAKMARSPEPVQSDWEPAEEDVTYLAKTLYGECRGVEDKAQQAAVAWCILNRVSSSRFQGDTVREIVTAPRQFSGYKDNFPVTNELKELAVDVLKRWHAEYCGLAEDVGRTLPTDYFFFHGDGTRNYFRQEYRSTEYWDWCLKSPYEEGAT